MRFVTLGNSRDIGASCHVLQVGDTGIALDAGADPNSDGPESLPTYGAAALDGIDHVLVTHAHHDHIGGLPSMVEEFPHAQVHLTRATRALADQVLPASARLQRRKFYEGTSQHPPLFTVEQLMEMSHLYSAHAYGEPITISGARFPATATFYYSGHILGAAGVLVEVRRNGRTWRLFYTSDTCAGAQSIIPGAVYPEPPVDVLVMESTLGADDEAELTTRRREEQRFLADMKRVLDRRGTVLVPAFALGRAQEILALLYRFRSNGQLSEDVPLYTAGGLRAISSIYDATREWTPRLDPAFQVFDVEQRRMPRGDAAKRKVLAEPGIHVVTSGMMFENTLSNWIAQQLIEHERHAILFVGYCKEDSPGGRLLEASANGSDGVVLDKRVGMQPLCCEVHRYRFSGHSNRRELIRLAKSLEPKVTLLVHGETLARNWMADNLVSAGLESEIILPEYCKPLEL